MGFKWAQNNNKLNFKQIKLFHQVHIVIYRVVVARVMF